ncbi:MAG: hypothetical protein LBH56_05675, partial [Coriobacteriales bacterium]|nr:hypothetical protein [Coriobacteriales bacterium]
MAQLIEYVDELVQEVGPRPAGTQQEHQAAELIAARLDEFGMKVDIEEFACVRNLGWVRALYYALCVGGAALSIFSGTLRVIGILLIVASVVLMFLDYLGKNPLFSLFKNSLSQNVIARHTPPGAEPSKRNRKIVILAHYDSTRMMLQAAPPVVSYYALLRRIVRVAMVVLIGVALLALVPFPEIGQTIIKVLTIAVAVIVLLALLVELINCVMPYNQGVNCNASSVGVLYGLADALAGGRDVVGERSRWTGGGAGGAGGAGGGGREGREAGAGGRAARGAREGAGVVEREGAPEDGAGAGGASAGREGRAARAGRAERVVRDGRDTQRAAAAGAGAAAGAAGAAGVAGVAGAAVAAGTAGAAGAAGAGGTAASPAAASSSPTLPHIERTVQSVAGSLANPFVSQRPAAPEIDEAEEERRRAAQEERQQAAQAAQEQAARAAAPAWFTKAKQNAERNAERRR